MQHNLLLAELIRYEPEADLAALRDGTTIDQPYLIIIFDKFVFRISDFGFIDVQSVFAVTHKRILVASALHTSVDCQMVMTYEGLM